MSVGGVDLAPKKKRPGTWKMSPEQLQQHLLLKTRARTVPDKKKPTLQRTQVQNNQRPRKTQKDTTPTR
jgi:hypothetical protein